MSGRVLVVNDCYAPIDIGGAERSVRMLVDGLRHRGVDAHVLTLAPPGHSPPGHSPPGHGPIGQRPTAPAVDGGAPPHVHRHRIPNCFWPYTDAPRPALHRLAWHAADLHNPWGRRLVAEAVQRLRPALVHTHNLAGFSTAAWAGVPDDLPVVHTLRDHYLQCPARTRWHGGRGCGPACRAATAVRRRAALRVQTVVGVSRSILSQHRTAGFFPTARHAVIPNAAARRPTRRSSGRSRPVRLGYLGRLAPEKGVGDLLRAQRQLPPTTTTLSVAGTGHAAEALRRTAGPGVVFAGHVDPTTWFADVDVLVVPSRWQEPFGRVAAEALGHGVPVVAADRGGLPEVVRDGVDGLLYDPDDPAALGRTLRRLTSDPQLLERLGSEARRRDLTTADDVVEQHLALYAELTSITRTVRDRAGGGREGSG